MEEIYRLTCHLTDIKRAYIGGWLKWMTERFFVTLRRHSIKLQNVLDLSKTNQLDHYEILGQNKDTKRERLSVRKTQNKQNLDIALVETQ